MLRRCLILALLLLFSLPVLAHSNLASIEPPVDDTFASAPPEIRLNFTETLEAEFSQISVYDNHGNLMALPNAFVPADAPSSLVLDSSSLGTGVYTVAWRVVSATDGHPSEGSFPLRIGSNAAAISAVRPAAEAVDSSALRTFNLLSLALLIGAIVFPLFIYSDAPILPRYLAFAWLIVGLSGIGILFMQAALVAGSWQAAFNAIPTLLSSSRFGLLWLARMGLWLALGFFSLKPLVGTQRAVSVFRGIRLFLAMALLLVQSLMSHASGALDSWAAVTADWLHLLAMGAWVGGLVAFFLIIGTLRKQVALLSTITARFSNLARLCVALLILTGAYAGWLHVGNLDALLNTAYGQALLVKLLLFLPLLALGAVNLLLTSRGLQAGEFVWSKRLRGLLTAEIALTLGILAAVGSMTSVEPARTAYQAPAPTAPQPFFEMRVLDGMMVHLTIEPNLVGENRFYVDLLSEDMSAPINDASAISLSFGETTVNAILQGGGRYTAEGLLNLAGTNTISLNIEAGNQSSQLDFQPYVNAQTQYVNLAQFTVQERSAALLLTGLTGLALSLYLLSRSFPQKWLVAPVLLLATGLISFSGVWLLIPQNSSDAPIKLIVGGERPYLITAGGAILQPSADGYEVLPLDAHANDLYREANGTLWVATDSGLYRDENGLWTLENEMPAQEIVSTHGFILALGETGIYRIEEGNVVHDSRNLELPLPAPARDFVMLGNHSHVLLNGTAVYSTTSVGLGWTDLAAPLPLEHIGADEHGNLLASSAEGFWTWDWATASWSERTDLPQGASDWDIFNNELYLLADGKLYRGSEPVNLQGQFVDIAYQYPDSLWLLENNGSLWRQRLGSADWERQ